MKKYKDFLLENDDHLIGYYKFNDQETENLIKNNCYEFKPENNFQIVRDIGKKPEVNVNYLVNPKQRKRASYAFNNTYTLLIDNFESWKDFPKRSEAMIATLNNKGGERLNVKYSVVPFDDAVWGVCPSNDIWYKWEKLKLSYGGDQIFYLMQKLNDWYSHNNYNDDLEDQDFDGLVYQINKLKNYITSSISLSPLRVMAKFAKYVESFDGNKPLIEILEELMNPHENGFKLLTGNELFDMPYGEYEIWTNDKVILKNNFKDEKI